MSPWLLTVAHRGRRQDMILRIPVPGRIAPAGILTNADALALAETRNVAAPRLIACDRTGQEADVIASLETALPGVSEFPDDLDAEQLRRMGAAMARVHDIGLEPQPFLAPRTRPIQPDDYATDRRWAALYRSNPGDRDNILAAYLATTEFPLDEPRILLSRTTSTPLLLLADDLVRDYPQPTESNVLVHGDLWPGNTRWLSGCFTALIDWKTAGVGNPGVDLGSMRMQVALRYGLPAAEFVREGWEAHMGRPATDVAYWDAVAALNTPTVMEGWPGCDPTSHPLGSRAVTARRDAFLRQAVDPMTLGLVP
ncbi:MAG: aminoglycoside phosphotransferase family protein [Thermomicrobiales bacterium]